MGIQVKKTRDGLHLCQKQYLVNLLKSSKFDNLKPSPTPIANQDLYVDDVLIEEGKEYRRIIGSLQYLTLTWLDIQYAVNKLSRFMAAPKMLHYTAMKKMLRYLSGTQNLGILIKKVPKFVISGFCDAD